MKPISKLSLTCLTFVSSILTSAFSETPKSTLPNAIPGGAQFIKQHPESDTNKDGILTYQEKETYCIHKIITTLGGNHTFHRVMIPMRDGVKLAAGVFTPKETGKFPVVLTRTSYGIWSAAFHDSRHYKDQKVVYICQDLRGDGESEGKGTLDPISFDNEIKDGYDTTEWIAKQPYSNGKIGITGTSGHGFSGYMAYLAKPQHLTSVYTNVSGGNSDLYWLFHNGVRREMYNWLGNRNMHVPQWPKPTIRPFDIHQYNKTTDFAANNNSTIFIAKTGWYDIFAESALDYFSKFAQKGNIFLKVDAIGHGNMAGKPFPYRPIPAKWQIPNFVDTLQNPAKYHAKKSQMLYYLMGDSTDPNAPGNEYKVTDVWPVPHTAVSYYMNQNGALTTNKPNQASAQSSFKYDPRNPVPSLGGDVFIHKGVGPIDQRSLKDRKDILRFTTAPLTAPLEVTGKIKAELYVSTDVEDTTFTAKLIDVYPDGYEAIVRDSIAMTRFHKNLKEPSKIEKGKVYKLDIDMWSTALVINKGHRIAVHISSSNSPKYEVHPNTYDPIDVISFKDVPIATNNLMLSKSHASRIILPVVK